MAMCSPGRWRKVGQFLNADSAKSGRIAARYSWMGIPRWRQLSVADKMAASRDSAVGLPTWIQFFLPIGTPRMEFSARLLLSSTQGIRESSPAKVRARKPLPRLICWQATRAAGWAAFSFSWIVPSNFGALAQTAGNAAKLLSCNPPERLAEGIPDYKKL